MGDATDRDQDAVGLPRDATEINEARATLEAMGRRLRQHSPLEELGPLFAPEARGEKRA